jgi:hypothetical protein
MDERAAQAKPQETLNTKVNKIAKQLINEQPLDES